ncbi:hypothetical protein HNP02_004256 [Mycobacterium sp. AZCC_0083]|nr:hypothetical protein [Mycobacterium sp. AZCC_0083]
MLAANIASNAPNPSSHPRVSVEKYDQLGLLVVLRTAHVNEPATSAAMMAPAIR